MIRVPRERVRPPSVLSDSDSPAANERKKAKDHFDGTKPPEKPFEFKAYKHEAVKARLEELFRGKCAYCESYYAAVHPMDVEHWRPKAEVSPEDWEGTNALSGYWFLASEWSNLLPSCIDCNRARLQKEEGSGSTRLLGKANRFPVEQASPRAKAREEVGKERPLLLNPCDDEPSQHLQCDPNDAAILRPLNDSKKGEVSIEVYALNRAGLAVARRERLAKIQLHLFLLKTLSHLRERSSRKSEQRILDDLIDHELRALDAFRGEDEPFTMMSRAVIDDFMERVWKPQT